MAIDIAVNRPRHDPGKMRQNPDHLKGSGEHRPTTPRGEGQPDEASEKRNIDRSNAKLKAVKHSGLHKRRSKRST